MTNDKDSAVLLPCPLCGSSKVKIKTGGAGNWFIECAECRLTTDDRGYERTITAWNTRQPTQSDALAKAAVEIETLRAALKAAEEKLAAIEVENQRVTQSQIADLKRHLKEQDEVRGAAKWSSQ